jgi:hypothetical protein
MRLFEIYILIFYLTLILINLEKVHFVGLLHNYITMRGAKYIKNVMEIL